MIPILFYVLKVILCSAILYSYYWLVLRNNQFHQYNRFYLLGCTALSWILPLIKIDLVREQVIEAPKVFHFANAIASTNSAIEQDVIDKSIHFSWDNFVLVFGIGISFLFILRVLKSLWNLRNWVRHYPMKEFAGRNLYMTDVKGTPFSFFKLIFWNISIDLNSDVGQKILAHEVVHIEEHHSIDKLWIELQLVVGWFNPVTWLIKNELYLIHEFIADHKSIQNQDTSVLAELLLTSAYPTHNHLLTNSFFFSPIKRRIHMFSNSKNTKFGYLKRLSILPLMATTILLFAFRKEASVNSTPKTLTAEESKAALKKWEASPDGIMFKKWEASPAGKKVHSSAAKIRLSIKDYTKMEGVITSLTLPAGSRLGYGMMVKINKDDYILSFGQELNNEFERLHNMKVNDKIIIKSHYVSKAPKYAFPIVTGEYIEQKGKVLYKRVPRKGGC